MATAMQYLSDLRPAERPTMTQKLNAVADDAMADYGPQLQQYIGDHPDVTEALRKLLRYTAAKAAEVALERP